MVSKYTALRWIWCWGLLTLMLAWLAEITQQLWIFWATIISVTILVIGAGISVSRWVVIWWRVRQLFDAYYELNDKTIVYTYTLNPSTGTQSINLYLRMKTEANIGFINLTVKGTGQVPSLDRISNGDLGARNPDINDRKAKNGSWNLEFIRQPYRFRGQIIRIHISCKAITVFDGNLEVLLSCDKGIRKRELPLKV